MRIKKIILVALLAACIVFAFGCSEFSQPSGEGSTSSSAVEPEPEPEPEVYTWPLTGEEAPNEAAIQKLPLSIKIENSSMSRPQTGINRADLIYETRVEGGETRCNVLWQSDVPDDVGNVRSARLSDLWIVPQYDALFMYAGGNDEYYAGVPAFIAHDMSYHVAVDLYYRTKNRVAPHNLYLSLGKAYDAAAKLGYPTTTSTPKGLYFGDEKAGLPSADTAQGTATSITVTYANYSEAKWEWDAARQVYLRSQGGKIHKDAETDEQVFTTNVVLLYADYSQRAALDPAGSPTWDINLGGSGKAIICKDGKQYPCTWRADRNTPPVFIGADGNQIPLNVGRTWIEVPSANDTPVTVN